MFRPKPLAMEEDGFTAFLKRPPTERASACADRDTFTNNGRCSVAVPRKCELARKVATDPGAIMPGH